MQDRPLLAAALVVAAMAIIGFIDQFVRLLTIESSLWTFHIVRTAMIAAMALLWARAVPGALTVKRWPAVVARSLAMSTGLVIYFGALGFLPVAQAAAGLYTAPLWVLIISVAAFRRSVGPARAAAAAAGFAGVVLVLSPDPSALGWGTVLPVAAGLFYGLGVTVTRVWCREERALVLGLGSFLCLGLWGLCGIGVAAALGTEGDNFITRGWVAPSASVLWICFLQAAGSLVAVVLLTRAYLMAEASQIALLEYTVLAFSALFGFLIWRDEIGPAGFVGLAVIAAAGSVIAWRERRLAR